MNVLILGAGGREHALVKSLKDEGARIFCIPGNGGIARDAEVTNIPLHVPFSELLTFIQEKKIEFVIVGPEKPLVEGVVDVLEKESIPVLGPSQQAAQLEGSKMFAKELMKKYSIPTAEFECFRDVDEAQEYVSHCRYPLVIKADGLAAGKGVVICSGKRKAEMVLEDMLINNIFNMSHPKVVIEEYLEGKELSIIGLTDGEEIILFPPSRDYKRAGDDGTGPNTGGMGAFSSDSLLSESLENEILEKIMYPAIRGMKKEGMVYKGILYAGLMLTNNGPYVVEFNCRFGDPETQAILPRISENLLPLFRKVFTGGLSSRKIRTTSHPSLCVILASGGYPAEYRKGFAIKGLDKIEDKRVSVFHAGTEYKNGVFYTAGGRVLGVNAVEKDIETCRKVVYSSIDNICFSNMHYRSDIGKGEV